MFNRPLKSNIHTTYEWTFWKTKTHQMSRDRLKKKQKKQMYWVWQDSAGTVKFIHLAKGVYLSEISKISDVSLLIFSA